MQAHDAIPKAVAMKNSGNWQVTCNYIPAGLGYWITAAVVFEAAGRTDARKIACGFPGAKLATLRRAEVSRCDSSARD